MLNTGLKILLKNLKLPTNRFHPTKISTKTITLESPRILQRLPSTRHSKEKEEQLYSSEFGLN